MQMMKRRRLVLILVLTAVAAATPACGILDPNQEIEQKIDDNYQKWIDKGPGSYRYRLTQICFCPPDHTRTYLVTVANQQIVEVRDAETGAPPPAGYQARTVPDLFAILHAALGRDADQIDVVYDPQLGYPTRMRIDYDEQAADEEAEILAEGLVAIQP